MNHTKADLQVAQAKAGGANLLPPSRASSHAPLDMSFDPWLRPGLQFSATANTLAGDIVPSAQAFVAGIYALEESDLHRDCPCHAWARAIPASGVSLDELLRGVEYSNAEDKVEINSRWWIDESDQLLFRLDVNHHGGVTYSEAPKGGGVSTRVGDEGVLFHLIEGDTRVIGSVKPPPHTPVLMLVQSQTDGTNFVSPQTTDGAMATDILTHSDTPPSLLTRMIAKGFVVPIRPLLLIPEELPSRFGGVATIQDATAFLMDNRVITRDDMHELANSFTTQRSIKGTRGRGSTPFTVGGTTLLGASCRNPDLLGGVMRLDFKNTKGNDIPVAQYLLAVIDQAFALEAEIIAAQILCPLEMSRKHCDNATWKKRFKAVIKKPVGIVALSTPVPNLATSPRITKDKVAAAVTKAGRDARTFIYRGEPITMERHLKETRGRASGVRSPKVIRIYFEWIPAEQLIVVGWCGRHLPE